MLRKIIIYNVSQAERAINFEYFFTARKSRILYLRPQQRTNKRNKQANMAPTRLIVMLPKPKSVRTNK